MRILALSLMRVGDLFQHLHLAKQLKSKGHEVHFLIHDECQSAIKLLSDYQFHIFPRKKLGRMLVSKHMHPLASLQLLNEWLEKFNRLDFDEIQNWTHDRFSAKLMGLLTAQSKRGALFLYGKDETRWSPGLRYLDEHWGTARAPNRGYLETLALAMEIPGVLPPIFRTEGTGPVVLQVTTSDVKKTWPMKNWVQLAKWLADQGQEVVVVTAPDEHLGVASNAWDLRVQVLGLDWIRTFALLKRAKLLISGDTSILHLAVHAKTRILGLYLGSANPYKTGPFQSQVWTLTPQIECHPCYHRETCRTQDHRCHDLVTVQMVMDEFKRILSSVVDPNAMTDLAVNIQEQILKKIENGFNENGVSYGPRP